MILISKREFLERKNITKVNPWTLQTNRWTVMQSFQSAQMSLSYCRHVHPRNSCVQDREATYILAVAQRTGCQRSSPGSYLHDSPPRGVSSSRLVHLQSPLGWLLVCTGEKGRSRLSLQGDIAVAKAQGFESHCFLAHRTESSRSSPHARFSWIDKLHTVLYWDLLEKKNLSATSPLVREIVLSHFCHISSFLH